MSVERLAPFQPARADWLQAAMVALLLFALYAASSPRTVVVEDDGLFVLSSYFLGIEHPPGYPLFTLAGKLFTLLPFGTVAYRVHLASAFFGGLAGGAAWLCARSLVAGRLPAYLAAFALGLAPVFWSQAIIAEVYTLNVLLFLALVFLGLRAGSGVPPAMAFVFGLSLANHWPLMLLAAPGFAVLLWPRRGELLRRTPLLALLLVLGLLPYAWLVLRSWMQPPISFYGPLQSWQEFWYFVSRAGYAEVDAKPSANWLDQAKFLQFVVAQLGVQLALAGAALAAIGCAVQWQVWGRRIAAFLTLCFLMPTVGLVLLLGFDYDAIHKHVFHVYPLPAYAVASLWLALGFAWLMRRLAWSPAAARAAAVALVALFLASGSRTNWLADYDWAARYAQTVLKTLPPDAIVFVQGDADLGPIGYFHIVENWRPDITLYQAKGLVLGNRLFHPLRTDPQAADRAVQEAVERQPGPVIFTLETYAGYSRRDGWLFVEVDKSSRDAQRVTADLPEEALRFFEQSVAERRDANGWASFVQGELRRRYGVLLGRSLARGQAPSPRQARHAELLGKDFYGALGMVEGLMANTSGYSAGAVAGYLEAATALTPDDAPKWHLARFFGLRGLLRVDLGQQQGGVADLETALSIWPVAGNPALQPLEDHYRRAGNAAALEALRARVKRREH